MQEAVNIAPKTTLTSGWTLLLADLLALLLSFFILLYSIIPISDTNWNTMTSALAQQLNGVDTAAIAQNNRKQPPPLTFGVTVNYIAQVLAQRRSESRLLSQGRWEVAGSQLRIFLPTQTGFTNGDVEDLAQLGEFLDRFEVDLTLVVSAEDIAVAQKLGKTLGAAFTKRITPEAFKILTLRDTGFSSVLTNYELPRGYKSGQEIAILVEIRGEPMRKAEIR